MEDLNASRITTTSVIESTHIPFCYTSFDTLRQTNFIMNCILIPIVSIFGILGNITTIIILTYNGLNEATNIILTGLAVSDLFFSTTQFLHQLVEIIGLFYLEAAMALYGYYFVYLYGWNQYAVCISVHMVTFIAIERMIAVCFPFIASTTLNPYKIKLTVIAIYILVGILYIPRSFMFDLSHGLFSGTNITVILVTYSDFVLSNGFVIYNTGIMGPIAVFIPSGIIIICTVMIISKLSLSYKNMKKMASSEARAKRVKDIRSIKITLTICLCGLIFHLFPTNLFFFIIGDRNLFSLYCSVVISYFIILIYQINASINFVIYVIISPKFANTYKKLFFCDTLKTK